MEPSTENIIRMNPGWVPDLFFSIIKPIIKLCKPAFVNKTLKYLRRLILHTLPSILFTQFSKFWLKMKLAELIGMKLVECSVGIFCFPIWNSEQRKQHSLKYYLPFAYAWKGPKLASKTVSIVNLTALPNTIKQLWDFNSIFFNWFTTSFGNAEVMF